LFLIAGGLSACTAAPEGWRHTMHAASDTAALHLTCTGSGLADVTLGTLEGGLEGAVTGAAVAARMVNGNVGNEAALVFVGGSAAVGGTIGVGAGLGGGILNMPAGYGACLRAKGPAFSSPSDRLPET